MSKMSDLNIFEKEIEAIMGEYSDKVKALHNVLSGERGGEFMKMMLHIADLVEGGYDFWTVLDDEDTLQDPVGYWYRGSYSIFADPYEQIIVDNDEKE